MIEIRKVVYEPVSVDLQELVGLKEAAKELSMSMPGVIRAIERGALTGYRDPSKVKYHGSTLLLRAEVEAFKEKQKKKKAPK